VYDNITDRLHWMNSLLFSNEDKIVEKMAEKYRTFLQGYGVRPDLKSPITAVQWEVPQQQNGWACGLHVLENARMFFREPASKGGDLYVNSWHTSALYEDLRQDRLPGKPEPDDFELRMSSTWVDYIRRELGHSDGGPIRIPDLPIGEWARRKDLWNIPNNFWKASDDVHKNIKHHWWEWMSQRAKATQIGEDPGTILPSIEKDDHEAEVQVAEEQKKERRARAGVRTYPHARSPTRHLSPTHEEGWGGWANWHKQLERIRGSRKEKIDEQRTDRDARHEKRRPGVGKHEKGLPYTGKGLRRI
jgi:hypothetical protein